MSELYSELNLLSIKKDKSLIKAVSKLAKEIYLKHHSTYLNPISVEKMYNTYQTPKAIEYAIDKGEEYYIVKLLSKNIGYFAIKFEEKIKRVFLSKFYLDSKFRSLGIGRRLLNLVIEATKKSDCSKLELLVNKGNPTLKIYEKFGFEILKDICNDFGYGFIEDDYLMRLKV